MDALQAEAKLKIPARGTAPFNPLFARSSLCSGFRLRLLHGPARVTLPGFQRLLCGHNSVLLLGPGERPELQSLTPSPLMQDDLPIDPLLLAAADCELGVLGKGAARFRLPWARLSADSYLRWRLLAWSSQAEHRGGDAQKALCRGILMAAAADWRRRPLPASGGTPGATRSRFELAQQAAEVIETHWQEGISLDALAEHFELSPFHLLRSFRRGLGLTPHQYLLQLRLRRSFSLLESGGLRIIDIALASGFSSHGHYSTAFRKTFGISPLAYQRLGRDAERAAG